MHSRKIRLRVPIEPFLPVNWREKDKEEEEESDVEMEMEMIESDQVALDGRRSEMGWEREERTWRAKRAREEVGEDERRLIEAQKERERLLPY